MNSPEEIIEHHRRILAWAESLDEKIWRIPVAEGKWSAAEIISHFTEWDNFILEKRLPFFFKNENLPLSDIESINAKAAENAGNFSREKVIAEFLKTRTELLKKIAEFEPEQWDQSFTIGSEKLDLLRYLQGHAEHDVHHQQQVEKVRK